MARKKGKKLTGKRQAKTPKRSQPKKTQAQLRTVSANRLTQTLAAHKKWLETKGNQGKQARLPGEHLSGANLQEANLMGANLRKANLMGANLRKANLFKANLQKANLMGANLQKAHLFKANLQEANLWQANLQEAFLTEANLPGAHLSGANLQEANLMGTNLQEANLMGANLLEAFLLRANLQEADLTRADLQRANLTEVKGLSEATLHNANLDDATGLLGSEFARADVTGTKLPEDIRDFKVLQAVEETSKNARKIFLSMLLGCAYSWLTIAATTDARLLTNSTSSPLPIIGTEIPIASFYWVAPFILIVLYVYFNFYLQRLWKGLAGLPAIFPDGKSLDERAYPWLLNGLVRRHFGRLKKGRPLMAHLEEWVTILLAWWVVPATLFGFWLRYLPRHEWVGTWLHIGLLVASVAAAIIFYRSAARTLRGDERQPLRWKTFWQERRTYQSVGTVLVAIVLWVMSYGAINGIRPVGDPSFSDVEFTDVRTTVPWVFAQLGYSPFLDLVEADVSIKPSNWTGLGKKEELEAQIAQVP